MQVEKGKYCFPMHITKRDSYKESVALLLAYPYEIHIIKRCWTFNKEYLNI